MQVAHDLIDATKGIDKYMTLSHPESNIYHLIKSMILSRYIIYSALCLDALMEQKPQRRYDAYCKYCANNDIYSEQNNQSLLNMSLFSTTNSSQFLSIFIMAFALESNQKR
ncbi:hypothetical protein RF11_04973 [Thelohanellus kitauei]|uniref:Uncharacterized protein n=1 Tax=Thelohanellus kitauei TaxID=669202 RepID=A0A0C2NJU5_THEKT|nr:hypothetical protein RF11_04973 [Thelohanellus kitauei]